MFNQNNHLIIMEHIVKIQGVQLFIGDNLADSKKFSNIRLTLDKPIDGFMQDEKGVIVQGDIQEISIGLSKATKQLCQCNDDVMFYRSIIGRSFDQKDLTMLLLLSTLTIERTLVKQGEVIPDDPKEAVAARDLYLTNITKITLSPRGAAWLEKKLDD